MLAHTGDDDAGWAAEDPDRALRGLVLRYEEGLLDVRGRLPGLQKRYRLSRRTGEEAGAIERLDTWQDIGDRYHRLLRDAEAEVLMWDTAPYVPGEVGPAERTALDRGVHFRQLCDPDGMPDEVKQERTAVRGLHVRIHSDLPFRGAIADGTAAVITMDRASQNANALLVRPSPLLDGLVMLFETCWSRGVPIGRDASGLSAEEREVMGLLAAGLKDEAIARGTGTTTRTVRRRVQALLTALQARSRFHAGSEPARRGWV
ncbi:TrmB family transcriptional regulator [Streptomyces sp. NPDC002680]|uniref:TrmB family transcriptional regulator n=1 Tax=Streptomyces sp. NPDC002680 TaxID=3364659 RepID=UPI00369A2D12